MKDDVTAPSRLDELRAKKRQTAAAGAAQPRSRPVIRLAAADYLAAAEAIEAAMVRADLPIFRRGNRLVSPVIREVEGANGVRTAAAELAEIGIEWLRQFMERAANFERFNLRADKWLPTQPPEDIARLVLARIADWPFSEVTGIITAPTIGPKGQLIDAPGFDPATGLYLAELPLMPLIAERPTKEDAQAALEDLDALLAEFQFADEPSRSVALSGLITPVCRGAVPLAPLHSASAPEAGTGKSLLWDIASCIATGRACPVITASRNTDELEKRLGAVLLKGQPLVSVDNVNGNLASDQLCQILERPRVEVRILGSSKSPDIECRTSWYASGNNLRIIGDLNRRNITTRLDAGMERPELRSFRNDPVATVMRERGRYVAACLTIVRAYIAAGRPGRKPPLASYRQWSDLVRSALVWLGRADPVSTIDAMRENDPSLEQRMVVFAAWPADDVPYTAADLIQLAEPDAGTYGATEAGKELRAALISVAAGKGGVINPTRLGYWLRDNQDTQVGRRKLVRTGYDRKKTAVWMVKTPSPAGGA